MELSTNAAGGGGGEMFHDQYNFSCPLQMHGTFLQPTLEHMTLFIPHHHGAVYAEVLTHIFKIEQLKSFSHPSVNLQMFCCPLKSKIYHGPLFQPAPPPAINVGSTG